VAVAAYQEVAGWPVLANTYLPPPDRFAVCPPP
jgi:hypothetical protein